MIEYRDGLFLLETKNTGYYFYIGESGHLIHLHYGKCADIGDGMALKPKTTFIPGNTISYSTDNNIAFEDSLLEISACGKGDTQEGMINVIYDDGSYTSDFTYVSHEVLDTKPVLSTLPTAYAKEDVNSLRIILKDNVHNITVELLYSVFYESDVITRSMIVRNTSDKTIRLDKAYSALLDIMDKDYELVSFGGAWTKEMEMYVTPLVHGKHVISSSMGVSGSRANPFTMVRSSEATEYSGEVYGFNLIYSGNHYEAFEKGAFGRLRALMGINSDNFEYILMPDEMFETPEAVLTYTDCGMQGITANMHHFVNNHIVRGQWQKKERPTLINSWEAFYFDINESRILSLAKEAANCGIEMVVIDDGWFGKRDDDKSSLGDWIVNPKKFPHGLKWLSDKVNALGVKLGIWIEPEMISIDSSLYKEHPEWAVKNPQGEQSLGRNQMILDLTNSEVRDYIVSSISQVLSSANIEYVKWDMNRIFSDCFSNVLTGEHMREFSHRYVLGLYDVMGRLTEGFPHILFEGCASGGNRFDLGILCYCPQIWASDDTDSVERLRIQEGYSYGYPLSTISAHASGCPNHQTLRNTPLSSRCNVAYFGCFGVECNILEMSKEELDKLKAYVTFYKNYRNVFLYGDFYRIAGGNETKLMCVSKDKKTALALYMRVLARPAMPHVSFRAKGLDDKKKYHFYNIPESVNVKVFGELINTIAPIHVKKDSLLHNAVAKFVKLPGETDDYTVSGSLLNNIGIVLKDNYQGTGFDENVRAFSDFSSRIYIMEEAYED